MQTQFLKISHTSLIQKSISIATVMIAICGLSSCERTVTQAPLPNLDSSFLEWCLQKESISAEARKTVEALLEKAGTSDCQAASEDLLSRSLLNLNGLNLTDISPVAQLTNLESLSLSDNEITDISPLSELTNLKKLYLSGNEIVSQTCPVSPESICEF
ncbi:MAG: leucine-rich repeat domain-containing protein [Cyanobacteria bacterium J06592_8]